MEERADIYIKIVCDYLRQPVDLVLSKSRKRELCEARQVISYVLKLHTKLSLLKIARKLNYISHASPWRDCRQISFFLEHDRNFAIRINPLLDKCEYAAAELKRKAKALEGEIPAPGDLCWFWNPHNRMPLIGTLERIYRTENNELRFIRRESPQNLSYSDCIYADEFIIPERFRPETKLMTI